MQSAKLRNASRAISVDPSAGSRRVGTPLGITRKKESGSGGRLIELNWGKYLVLRHAQILFMTVVIDNRLMWAAKPESI